MDLHRGALVSAPRHRLSMCCGGNQSGAVAAGSLKDSAVILDGPVPLASEMNAASAQARATRLRLQAGARIETSRGLSGRQAPSAVDLPEGRQQYSRQRHEDDDGHNDGSAARR